MSSCVNNTSSEAFESALGFNYLCLLGDSWIACVELSCLVLLSFYLLSSTADNFFSPTLGTICCKLQLSPEVAGVTLLALGNGAPDVFSSLASFTNPSASAELGLAALLGAAMFLLCVVFGNICRVAPEVSLTRATFSRDLGFFALTVCWILAWSLTGRDTTVWVACIYVLIYFVFVVVVLLQEKLRRKTRRRGSLTETPLLDTSPRMLASGSWLSLTELERRALEEEGELDDEQSTDISIQSCDEEGQAPQVIEDYLQLPGEEVTSEDDWEGRRVPLLQREDTINATLSNFFWRNLELHRQGNRSRKARGTSQDHDSVVSSEGEESFRAGYSTCSRLFHPKKAWRLTTRKVHEISEELEGLSKWQIIFWFFEIPFNFMRRLTIPSLEKSTWYKPLACAQPLTCILFALAVTGNFSADAILPASMRTILLCIALGASISFQFLLHKSEPPRGKFLEGVFLSLAFFCSVCWVYSVANELVAVLNTLGFIFKIDGSILGLTVLAWGNSAGDFVANAAIARQGMPRMAIAGCFGGPLLNILIGIGLSLTIATVRQSPKPVPFHADANCLFSCACLLGVLSCIYVSCFANGFVVPSFLHRILFSIYGVYIVVSLVIVMV